MSLILIAAAVAAADIVAGLLFTNSRLANILSTRYTLAFAAGAMLTLAFVELIPEANLLVNAWYLALGFGGFYMIDRVITPRLDKEKNTVTRMGMGLGSVIGMASDNITDGVAIAVGYLLSPELGILMTIAVALHEIPQGITSAAIMKNLRFKLRTIITILAVAGSMYVVGISISGLIPEAFFSVILAFVAGSFIYAGSRFLITQTRNINLRFIGMVLMGIITMYVLESVVAA
jgi:ZIP family zinc transporter